MNYWSKGIRAVAVLVGVKGLLGFAGGLLALSPMSRDMAPLVSHLLAFTHLSPDGAIAHWLNETADKVQNHHQGLACISFCWGALKLVEGVGLWFEQRWAEWLVLVSTAVLFLPIIIWELMEKVTWMRIGALLMSVGVLLFMAMVLYHNHKAKPKAQGQALDAAV